MTDIVLVFLLLRLTDFKHCSVIPIIGWEQVNKGCPAWKESKYGVISGPYVSVFGLNAKIYEVNLRIQSEYRKIQTRNNSVFEYFSRIELRGTICKLESGKNELQINWLFFVRWEHWSYFLLVNKKSCSNIFTTLFSTSKLVLKKFTGLHLDICLLFILLFRYFNPFHATNLFLYRLKTLKNFSFLNIFKGYRKKPVAENLLKNC